MPGLSHALVPAQELPRGGSFGRLLLQMPVIQKASYVGIGPRNISVTDHSNYELANTGPRTREAPTDVLPKSLLISGAKNEPSGHGEVLLLK